MAYLPIGRVSTFANVLMEEATAKQLHLIHR